MSFITREHRETGPTDWSNTAKSRVVARQGMHDRGAESFIKINLDARAAASRRIGPRSGPAPWSDLKRVFSALIAKLADRRVVLNMQVRLGMPIDL